jgi:DNA-binding transcriptional ArsR family regulator
MTRVCFTEDDLVRIRFCPTPLPLVETVLGLAELRAQQPDAASSVWSAQARRAFPGTARPLLDLIPPGGYSPEFLDPVVTDLDEGLDIMTATPRQELRSQLAAAWRHRGRPPSWLQALAEGDAEALLTVRRALRDFYTACVAPYWPVITASAHADMAERLPVLAAGGLAAVFGTLHEDLSWSKRALQRADKCLAKVGRPGEFWLGGQGLQLVPSVLWTGPPVFCIGPPETGGNALIYPAHPPATQNSADGTRDLAGLLGPTRAAVLQALRDPCGTGKLAGRLGISAASASEHATALRNADLIRTTRHGRGVWHSLTSLGQSLLAGN